MNRIEYNLTKKEETILTEKFESVMLLRQRQVNEILQKKNKNKYLILYIYIIEYMNRGGISTYIFEKCLCILMPKLIEYFDFSIGPFQMKYSFVKLYESSPDSCVKCYTMFLPFLLIKIDVFS